MRASLPRERKTFRPIELPQQTAKATRDAPVEPCDER